MGERDPYLLGLQASKEGKPLSANPYRKSHPRRKWELGWYDVPREAIRCAECWCENGGAECKWIMSGD